MGWEEHVVRIGEMRNAYNSMVGISGSKRPLGRPRCRWEDNIRMNLRETGQEVVGWMHVAQDRDKWWALVNIVVDFRVPKSQEIS
jgi:hypothetical protein